MIIVNSADEILAFLIRAWSEEKNVKYRRGLWFSCIPKRKEVYIPDYVRDRAEDWKRDQFRYCSDPSGPRLRIVHLRNNLEGLGLKRKEAERYARELFKEWGLQ